MRVAYTADNSVLDIPPSAVWVDDAFVFGICYCPYREISARKILFERTAETNRIRFSAVGVASVGAKGRYLYRLAVRKNGNGAVLYSGGNDRIGCKNSAHLVWQC